jgi:hypothetical protein
MSELQSVARRLRNFCGIVILIHCGCTEVEQEKRGASASKLKSKTSKKKQQCQQASTAELGSTAEEAARYANDCLSFPITLRILQLAFYLQDMNTPAKKATAGLSKSEREDDHAEEDSNVSECMQTCYYNSIATFSSPFYFYG